MKRQWITRENIWLAAMISSLIFLVLVTIAVLASCSPAFDPAPLTAQVDKAQAAGASAQTMATQAKTTADKNAGRLAAIERLIPGMATQAYVQAQVKAASSLPAEFATLKNQANANASAITQLAGRQATLESKVNASITSNQKWVKDYVDGHCLTQADKLTQDVEIERLKHQVDELTAQLKAQGVIQ